MKFEFDQLGPLYHGEVELADFTILCGENNTGKTYVTYALYCLLKAWKRLINLELSQELAQLQNKGIVTINIKSKIVDNWDVITDQVLSKFHEEIPAMLSSKSALFNKTKFIFDLPISNAWEEKPYVRELRSNKNTLLVTLTKAENSTEIEIAAIQTEEVNQYTLRPLGEFIEEALIDMLLAESLPEVFIASTERTGATSFKNQLNLATSRVIDLLNQVHKEGEENLTPLKVFETIYGRREYALPVDHNVKFINQLPTENSEEGAFYQSNTELLKHLEDVVGGSYVTNKEGVTQFQPLGTNLKLSLGEVSSSVRSLLIVWYWLKYHARYGDMLMIDEPELNLHPINQRKLVRFIADLIRRGIKVFMTTHSDYIVKEINTLIMLNKESESLNKIREKYGYEQTERLSHTQINLYMVRDKKDGRRKKPLKILESADISPTLGIEAPSFDETIDEMNAMQDAIYYAE